MKTPFAHSFLGRLFPVVIFVMSYACSKSDHRDDPGKGYLSLTTGISVETFDVYNNLKAADPGEFAVSIFDVSGIEVVSFPRAADIPELIDLPAGSYYAVANSGNNLPAIFDNPYYYGESEEFVIVAGETATALITCVLSNIMVTVVYAQTVIDGFDSYETTIRSAEGSLTFGMSETRAGYFSQGPLDIEATLTYLNGSGTPETLILTGSIPDPLAGRHYEIRIEACRTDGYGTILLDIDESYETELVTLHRPIEYGDLLITEIMYNPLALDDTQGEWIELYNNSGFTQNLRGLVIRRGSNNALHVIASDVMLAPASYAVLARSAAASDSVDYVYGSAISLGNSGENLIVNTFGTDGTDGDVICSVDYGASGFPSGVNGKSIQLDPGITGAGEAMLGTNWCVSTLPYNTGDLGTPGSINTTCQ
jgi:hypothetical protein